MALDDILIRIRTAFEGKGAQEAAKSLDALDASSKRAAPALDKTAAASTAAGKATRVSSEEFTRAARTASAMGGSLEGVGALISQMSSRIGGLAGSLPVIGLLWAAFTTWKTAIMAVVDAQKLQAEVLRTIKVENVAAQIASLSEAYAKLTKEIDRTSTSQKIMLQGQQAIYEASARQEKANLDLAELDETSAEKDPLKQTAIKARYDRQRGVVDSRLAGQGEETKMNQILIERTDAENRRDAAKAQLPALAQKAAEINRLYTELQVQRDEKLMLLDDMPHTEKAYNNVEAEYGPKIKILLEKNQEILAEMQKAREVVNTTTDTAAGLDMQIQAQVSNLGTRRTEATVADRRASLNENNATTAVSVADLAAKKAAAEAQLPQFAAQAQSAQEYLATVPDRARSGTYSQADQIAMQQALASAQEQTALLQSFIARIGKEMAKQNEILRTIPSSN